MEPCCRLLPPWQQGGDQIDHTWDLTPRAEVPAARSLPVGALHGGEQISSSHEKQAEGFGGL